MPWNHEAVQEDMEAELQHVRGDPTCQVPERLKRTLSRASLFHVQNIRKAIKRLKRGSSPGIDGLNAELVLLLVDDDTFITTGGSLARRGPFLLLLFFYIGAMSENARKKIIKDSLNALISRGSGSPFDDGPTAISIDLV